MTTAGTEGADDETLVDLRCSVVVARGAEVVLIKRDQARRSPGADHDWVLPGGRPRAREGLAACARREVLEETGLRINPTRCAFVGEVIAPDGTRTIEVIFLVSVSSAEPPDLIGEPGDEPTWVSLADARAVHMRPPIAGFLPDLVGGRAATAAYLGNLWRGEVTDRERDR